jgi:solute carrier family 25 protein 38
MTSLDPRKSDALVGAFSGFLTGVILQPLEIIKVCLIVNPTRLAAIADANFLTASYSTIKMVHQIEGIKGFWKGLSPALLEMVFGSAVYFETLYTLTHNFNYLHFKGAHSDFWASSIARTTSSFLSNPFAVIRTRSQLPGFSDYSSVWDGIKKIKAQEGIRGFFKGSVPCMLKDAPFAGLYFAFMNMAKIYLQPLHLSSPTNTMAAGMIAGMIATGITHPFEVVRTVIQADLSTNYEVGVAKRLAVIYQQEGLKGYMKGLAPRLVKKPLANAMTFTLFEIVKGHDHKTHK